MKIVLVLTFLLFNTFAFDIHNIYVGVDATINAKGDKSYGSSTDAIQFTYRVDQGVQLKFGYRLYDELVIEYAYSKFYSNEYKDFDIHSLAGVLLLKHIGTHDIFDTSFNLYPAIELGITKDVFDVGGSAYYEYDKNVDFVISYRNLLQGLSFGGENNSIDGYYIGIRYRL